MTTQWRHQESQFRAWFSQRHYDARNWRKKLTGLVTRNFDPRLIFVNTGFAGKTKNLLAQNVAHDFACAAFN